MDARSLEACGRKARRRLGSLLLDRPFLAWPIIFRGSARRGWSSFHNRHEILIPNPSGPGYDCDWKWSSDLNLAREFRGAGGRLLSAAFEEWPLSTDPVAEATTGPDVSFVVGHRGEERLPLLRATLSSLLGQKGCSVEVIVVEQAREPVLRGGLPPPARWIHQVPPVREMPYSRAWAFNRGAREATGHIVIFHDNDILAPEAYAAEVLRLARAGFQAMRLQRFVFYLDQATTSRLLASGPEVLYGSGRVGIDCIRQNCDGGTIAVKRDAYSQIGGHDEAFLGWGGEDNEFFDRCRLLNLHAWGYLPFVHLWHGPQPEKAQPSAAIGYLEQAMFVPREARARRLSALPFGLSERPLTNPKA